MTSPQGARHTGTGGRAAPILEGLRVLVVDDRAELCDLFALLLKVDGARATGSPRPPAVAIVTGHDEPHLSRARSAGAHAVFRKPVDWGDIVAFLGRLRPRSVGVDGLAA